MYYLLYIFLYLLSLLPFPVLYFISDGVYVLIYYIVGYRKDIVLSNLSIAFPEKSIDEHKAIAKKFYRNFTDNFIETIKLLSISKKQLKNRFVIEFDILDEYYSTGKNVQLHLGHFFNWEYANLALSVESKLATLVVYMPIANSAMNKIFNALRSRFGAKMIAATSFLREFKPYSKERFYLVFVADQSAGNTNLAYWLPFFGELTPFVTGPEKSARLTNAVCLYAKFKKIKRGYYHIRFYEIADGLTRFEEGEITRRMIEHLENNIREEPADYLWTHRRWKHEFDPLQHRAL